MIFWKRVKILEHERGLLFREGDFDRVLAPGVHWLTDPLGRLRVDKLSVRAPWLEHAELDSIVKSGRLGREITVLDLEDHQRALVWLDGRFARVLGAGLHALWNVFAKVRFELVDARELRFQHAELQSILAAGMAARVQLALNIVQVEPGHVGLLFHDGRLRETLQPGTHALWNGVGRVKVQLIDRREGTLDVAGQDIMTADKVALRLNAVLTSRVADPEKAFASVTDYSQALYRDAQLALRAVIGTRELDVLLAEKDAVARELMEQVRARAAAYGVEVTALGIKDVILPGDMKDLLAKVTEAKKAAEAAFITRREETAAMRSQANTAKLLENNPTLMRLRELEVMERVAAGGHLTVILGEQGLLERVTKLL